MKLSDLILPLVVLGGPGYYFLCKKVARFLAALFAGPTRTRRTLIGLMFYALIYLVWSVVMALLIISAYDPKVNLAAPLW